MKQTDYYLTIIYSSLLSPWEHNLSFVCAISTVFGCGLLLIAKKILKNIMHSSGTVWKDRDAKRGFPVSTEKHEAAKEPDISTAPSSPKLLDHQCLSTFKIFIKLRHWGMEAHLLTKIYSKRCPISLRFKAKYFIPDRVTQSKLLVHDATLEPILSH